MEICASANRRFVAKIMYSFLSSNVFVLFILKQKIERRKMLELKGIEVTIQVRYETAVVTEKWKIIFK